MSRMAPIVSVKGDDTSQYRRLTPVECERLQGFPDGWTEGISDLQRYNCLGNSVTVNVIEAKTVIKSTNTVFHPCIFSIFLTGTITYCIIV